MGWPFDDEEDEGQDAEVTAAPEPTAPASSPPAAPSVRDYIMQKYKLASDDSGVRDAQEKARGMNLIAGLGRAAEGFARARSQAYGGQGVNNATWNGIAEQGQQGVVNAVQARKNAMDQALTEDKLGWQAKERAHQQKSWGTQDQLDQQKLKGGEFDLNEKKNNSELSNLKLDNAKLDFSNSKNLMDASSPESLAATETYKRVGARTGVKVPDGLSATQLSALYGRDPLKELVTMRDIDVKAEGNRVARDANQFSREAAAKDREDKALNTEFEQFTNGIKGSVRDSIGNEKRKLQNTTHAMAVLDHYGDKLDNLTPEQVQEVAGAMAATVSQGHPAESTIHAMTPKSAHADLSKALQYITGAPQGAGLGEQMKLYKQMLQRQADTSMQIIGGEVGPIIANKKHLRDRDADRFNSILQEAGITVDPNGKMMAYKPTYMPVGGQGPAMKGDGATEPGTAFAAPAGPSHSLQDIDAEIARRKKAKSGNGSGASGGF